MAKEIKVTCDVKERLAVSDLTPLQGDLKVLSKEKLEKLKKSIRKFGFAFPVFVWENAEDAKIYILDGHQRMNALADLKKEGYKIPQLPVAFIQAKDIAEARNKLLAVASQYGSFTKSGLKDFLDEYEFNVEDLVSTFDFPELDIAEFVGTNLLEPDQDDASEVKADKTIVSTHERAKAGEGEKNTDQVRQVQLFLNAEQHERFLQQASFMIENDGFKNLTEVVVGAMNEKFASYKKA